MHPRRTYFYLVTCPHAPLPDPSMSAFMSRTVITPPLSSSSSGSDAADEDRRRQLSPSPEVDLSSPELDDVDDDIPMPSTPPGSFSGRMPRLTADMPRNHRSASPPLEKDEKEFTQTAEGLQKRKLSGDMLSAVPDDHHMDLDDATRDDSLFGGEPKTLTPAVPHHQLVLMASPAIRPTFGLNAKKDGDGDGWARLDSMVGWGPEPREHRAGRAGRPDDRLLMALVFFFLPLPPPSSAPPLLAKTNISELVRACLCV